MGYDIMQCIFFAISNKRNNYEKITKLNILNTKNNLCAKEMLAMTL